MANPDQGMLDFNGSRYILPKKAGLAVFEALSGCEVYRYSSSRWEQINGRGTDVPYIHMALPEEMPSLKVISLVQFHIGVENQRVKDEEEARKNASDA